MQPILDSKNKTKIIKILKTIASKDKNKSNEGQDALATLLGPIVDRVLKAIPPTF